MMIKGIRALILLILVLIICTAHAQRRQKPVFVFIHGAWGGAWAFKKVDSLLTESGCKVYRQSLTGLGERSHLANTDIGLQTHIQDVVNMIMFENLHNVILVGHSYGGMVTSGVADSIPDRIKKIIYLDAFVPSNGESVMNIFTNREEQLKKMLVNGFLIPTWVPAGKQPPKDVPHPYKTFTDPIQLHNRAEKIPSAYILTVEKGTPAKDDDFYSQSERARKKGWSVITLEADHNPQWSAPEAFVKILLTLQ